MGVFCSPLAIGWLGGLNSGYDVLGIGKDDVPVFFKPALEDALFLGQDRTYLVEAITVHTRARVPRDSADKLG